MAKGDIVVGKIFTFDSAHQLIGHCGKCANLHGHTYKLEIALKGPTIAHPDLNVVRTTDVEERAKQVSDEGFVIDFTDLKAIVKELVVDKLDHAFIAMGNEPWLDSYLGTEQKVAILGFRTTVENMAQWVCWTLKKEGLPIYSVKMWETPTGWAEVFAADLPIDGPTYRTIGDCDI